jgi:hypothetical protein
MGRQAPSSNELKKQDEAKAFPPYGYMAIDGEAKSSTDKNPPTSLTSP